MYIYVKSKFKLNSEKRKKIKPLKIQVMFIAQTNEFDIIVA